MVQRVFKIQRGHQAPRQVGQSPRLCWASEPKGFACVADLEKVQRFALIELWNEGIL